MTLHNHSAQLLTKELFSLIDDEAKDGDRELSGKCIAFFIRSPIKSQSRTFFTGFCSPVVFWSGKAVFAIMSLPTC